MADKFVHFAAAPFRPICGANEPNQKTTTIRSDATCPVCRELTHWTSAEVEAWALLRNAHEIPFQYTGRAIDYHHAANRIIALANRIKVQRQQELAGG